MDSLIWQVSIRSQEKERMKGFFFREKEANSRQSTAYICCKTLISKEMKRRGGTPHTFFFQKHPSNSEKRACVFKY
jgi:hypothetical protein